MQNFEQKIAEFIEANDLFAGEGGVLVAVSGGADSVSLLFALSNLIKAGRLDIELSVGHINHNLRGELSDGDEQFVIELARKLSLPVVTRSVDVSGFAAANKLSVETAARELRLKSLMAIAVSMNCSKVATAHHRDDNAETMVHRLMRGTAYRGLCGIRPVRELGNIDIIRPMLGVTRDEVIGFCKENDIDFRHDHTNDECAYTRNRIRHRLLPVLESECAGSLSDSLAKLSQTSGKLYSAIDSQMDRLWQEVLMSQDASSITLCLKTFAEQRPLVKAELIRRSLVGVGCGQRDVSMVHYRSIMEIGASCGRKQIGLPEGFCVRVEHGRMAFCVPEILPESSDRPAEEEALIDIEGRTVFEDRVIEAKVFDAAECDIETFIRKKDKCVEWFDLDKISGALRVRYRREGDRFCPLGQSKEKRVGKFLTDCRIDYGLRQDYLIVEDDEKIIWLAGERACELTKVDEKTRNILQLKNIRR
jgi:tRNA(Ile)-lysidine synthase